MWILRFQFIVTVIQLIGIAYQLRIYQQAKRLYMRYKYEFPEGVSDYMNTVVERVQYSGTLIMRWYERADKVTNTVTGEVLKDRNEVK